MEKIKGLVTIGYHFGELEWGKSVREEYELRNLKNNRNIEFYEIENSDVETGKRCQNSLEEIKEIADFKKTNLWIDIHCGIGFEKYKLEKLYGWIKRKKKIIEEMEKLGFSTLNLNRKYIIDLDIIDNIGVPCALIDALFSKNTYKKKGKSYHKGLEETLNLINQVYDIHSNYLLK